MTIQRKINKQSRLERKDDRPLPAIEVQLAELGTAFDTFKTASAAELEAKTKGFVSEEIKTALETATKGITDAMEATKTAAETKDAEMVIRVDSLEAALKRKSSSGTPEGEIEAKAAATEFFRVSTKNSSLAEGDEKIDMVAYGDYKSGFMGYLRTTQDSPQSVDNIKAMQIGGDPKGGYLVPADLLPNRVTKEFDTSPIRSIANVQTVSRDRAEIVIDRGRNSSGWTGETSSRPETNTPELAIKEIKVDEIYSYPHATQNMIDDAAFNVPEWLQMKANQDFTLKENTAFVTGDGNMKPRGFQSYTADAVIDTSYDDTDTDGKIEYVPTDAAAAITADGLIELVYSLKAAYRAGATFVMNRKTLAAVRKLQDGDGHYYWQPSLQAGQPSLLLGYPVLEAEDMPDVAANSFPIAFGNFSRGYQIIDRQGTRLLVDPYTNKPYVGFYMTRRVGGDVIDFEAIKYQKVEVIA